MTNTKGNWRVALIRVANGNYIQQVQSESGAPICTPVQPCDGPDGADECEANACLIAAAPELLEALRACMGFIEAHDETHHDGATLGPTYSAARAAIAKAEGAQ